MSQERYAVTPTSSGVRKSGASTRAVTARPAYAGAASSFAGTRPFGLGGLGTRRQRYWFALIGTLALLLPYAGVIGSAIKAEIEAPAAIVPIPALSVPAATFPKLAVPKFRAYRAAPPLASNLRHPAATARTTRTLWRTITTTTSMRRVVTHRTVTRAPARVKVISSSYSMRPAAPKHNRRDAARASRGSTRASRGSINTAPVVTTTTGAQATMPTASPTVPTPTDTAATTSPSSPSPQAGASAPQGSAAPLSQTRRAEDVSGMSTDATAASAAPAAQDSAAATSPAPDSTAVASDPAATTTAAAYDPAPATTAAAPDPTSTTAAPAATTPAVSPTPPSSTAASSTPPTPTPTPAAPNAPASTTPNSLTASPTETPVSSQQLSTPVSSSAAVEPTSEASVPTTTVETTTTTSTVEVPVTKTVTSVDTTTVPVTTSDSGAGTLAVSGVSTAATALTSAPETATLTTTDPTVVSSSDSPTNAATPGDLPGGVGTPQGSADATPAASDDSITPPPTDGATTLTSAALEPTSAASTPGSGRGPPSGGITVTYSPGDPDIDDTTGGTLTLTTDGTNLYASDGSFSQTIPISSITGGVLTIEATQVIFTSSSGTGNFQLAGAAVTVTASSTEGDSATGAGASPTATITLDNVTLTAASITLQATATANPSTAGSVGTTSLDSSPTAEVLIEGTSFVDATDGGLSISATVNESADASAQGTSGEASTSTDAAIAQATINTTAIAAVTGNSYVQATGALAISAVNATNVTTSGDASGATAGAGVAVAVVSTTTQAYVDSSDAAGPTSGSAVTISAVTNATAATTAVASPGGATADSTGSPASLTGATANVGGQDTAPSTSTSTSIQAVPVAAALAITSFSNNTEAFVSGTNTIQAPESITISASSVNSVPTSANASTVSSAPGSGAVGVGVAINIASSTTSAFVAGNTNLESPTVSIGAPLTWTSGTSYSQGQIVTDPNDRSTYEATAANTQNTNQAPDQDPSEWQQVSDNYSANAVSGQGDPSNTTIGSLALTVVTVAHQATVGNGSSNPGSVNVSADNSNLALTSASASTSTASATSDGQVFDPNAAGVVTADPNTPAVLDVINLPYRIEDSNGNLITNGAPLDYSTGGGSPIGGLVDGGHYYAENVQAVGNAMSLQLAATNGGSPLPLTPSAATGDGHILALVGVGVGVGASVAINVLNDTTNSAIDDGSALTGANNLTLKSNTSDTIDTEAVNGLDVGEALTPALAISIANVDTDASVGQSPVGSPPTLTLTGSLDAEATQSTSVTTIAENDPTGSSLGPAIAITDANDGVIATTYYHVVAGGAITLKASGASAITATTIPPNAGSSDISQMSSRLAQANDAATVSTDSSTPGAGTGPIGPGEPGSTVGVAITFNLGPATAAASAPAGLTVDPGGRLALTSVDPAAAGSHQGAAATQGEPLSVGDAVAINAGRVNAGASITARDSVASSGLSLSGLINSSGPAGALETSPSHNFTTTAAHGAPGSDTGGVNGGLAFKIVDVNATASQTGTDSSTCRGPPTADLNAGNSANGGEVPIQAISTTSRPDATAANADFDPDASGASNAENFGDPLNTIAAQSGATA